MLHELVVQGGLDIYFTSFDELAPRVDQVFQVARNMTAKPSLVTYRAINGESLLQTQIKKTSGAFKTRKPGQSVTGRKPGRRSKVRDVFF